MKSMKQATQRWKQPSEVPEDNTKVIQVAEHFLPEIATYMFENNFTVTSMFKGHIYDKLTEDDWVEYIPK
jgi:hypothetical protein